MPSILCLDRNAFISQAQPAKFMDFGLGKVQFTMLLIKLKDPIDVNKQTAYQSGM